MTPGYFSGKHFAQVDSTFYVIWKIEITSVNFIFFSKKRCIKYTVLETARRALQDYKIFFQKKLNFPKIFRSPISYARKFCFTDFLM